MVFGPIAITYNVNGLSSLTLDGPTPAKIFNGGITTWNDPAIQALNTGANLPAEPIHVVFRSDVSGTSDNFQKYLDAAPTARGVRAPARHSTAVSARAPRATTAPPRPSRRTEGAITYNEWSFAQAQAPEHGQDHHVGRSGPGDDQRRLGRQDDCRRLDLGQGNDLVLDTISFYKPTQPGAYPIVLATYEIVCSKYPDPQVGTAVKAFLQSTIGAGQNGLADNGYIPIPDALKSRLSDSRSMPSRDLRS